MAARMSEGGEGSSKSKRKRKRAAQKVLDRKVWDDKAFQALKKFKETHGHFDVKKDNSKPQLRKFVHNVRKNRSYLTRNQEQQLCTLGVLGPPGPPLLHRTSLPRKAKSLDWESNFELLRSFREKYGLFFVPSAAQASANGFDFDEGRRHRTLLWIHRQRLQKDQLQPERVAKLNEIGFRWTDEDDMVSLHLRPGELSDLHARVISLPRKKKTNERVWDDKKFQALRAFKREHGHCNPGESTKELQAFVIDLRKHRSSLTERQKKQLDCLCFQWGGDSNWTKEFERLRALKERFGHFCVPSPAQAMVAGIKYTESQRIRTLFWIQSQRAMKRQLLPEQVAKLDTIGFLWSYRTEVVHAVSHENFSDQRTLQSHEDSEIDTSMSSSTVSLVPEPTDLITSLNEDSEMLQGNTLGSRKPPEIKRPATPPPLKERHVKGTLVQKWDPDKGWLLGEIHCNLSCYKVVYEDHTEEEYALDSPTIDKLILNVESSVVGYEIGTPVWKYFDGDCWLFGAISSYHGDQYGVVYEDDENEEYLVDVREIHILVDQARSITLQDVLPAQPLIEICSV